MEYKELYPLLEKFLLDNDFYSQYVSFILEAVNMTLDEWVKWFTTSSNRRNHLESIMYIYLASDDLRSKWAELIKNTKNKAF